MKPPPPPGRNLHQPPPGQEGGQRRGRRRRAHRDLRLRRLLSRCRHRCGCYSCCRCCHPRFYALIVTPYSQILTIFIVTRAIIKILITIHQYNINSLFFVFPAVAVASHAVDEPTCTSSTERVCKEVPDFTYLDLARSGWIWQNLVRYGCNWKFWLDVARFG